MGVTDFKPKLDLLETGRQLVAMRSLRSHNRRVAIEINKLIRKSRVYTSPIKPSTRKTPD
jgi:hypothetical protein